MLMKAARCIIIFSVAAAVSACGGEKKLSRTDLKTELDQISYVLGLDIGKNFKERGIEVNHSPLFQGIRDGLEADSLLEDAEIQEARQALESRLRGGQAISRDELGKKNSSEGEAFLEANKQKDGVVTLASGLQYQILKAGTGPNPKPTDRVKTHYIGMLIDGSEFNNTYQLGAPATFQVNGVIAGWSEALQLMKVGAKWKLFVPSELAYGEAGAGSAIGPNAVLVFEVELLEILN